MVTLVDYILLVVIVTLIILIGFVQKIQKWLTKWRRKRREQEVIKMTAVADEDIDDLVDMTETTLMGGGGGGGANGDTNTNGGNISGSKALVSSSVSTPSSSRSSFLMNTISLVIGFQTSTSIIGLPLEFYNYGAQSYQFALCMVIAPIIIAIFFVPFLYKIKSASIYDYLDDKFGPDSRRVRRI